MYLRLKPVNYLRHAIYYNYLDPLRIMFSCRAMQATLVDVILSYYKRDATSCNIGGEVLQAEEMNFKVTGDLHYVTRATFFLKA